ncbi:galactose oxidase [Tothia fuscella]|uniref:Galactose oxidase n=1 Tax=Tothia fuscella TaxID=1048955 RepID=A0A9P4U1D2_9PEZI|nr:galactose oxidase [Tothia fuscella]
MTCTDAGAIQHSQRSAVPGNDSAAADAIPPSWTYRGCWIDNAYGRIIQSQEPDNQQLTPDSCITSCAQLGYSVAGMEYGVQCFCDNYIRNSGVLAAQDSECNMKCSGAAGEQELCGAGNRISVYSNSTLGAYQPPSPQVDGLPGKWNYVGCLSDAAGAPVRTFPYQVILKTNNTATNCLSLCSQYRYNAAGMEYGEECWCGDLADVVPNGATLKPESDCNMPCTGNATAGICGGPNRLTYYAWNSSLVDALFEWRYPSGTAAGKYQFYVPGRVVPLITTLGVNGKVTFLEKFGTGAPNTTGAYELDSSIVESGGDWLNAWREMHVQSDIFCSATLVLPDKAGRQLNIGGWALGATFGIRIYWPDGSPGQTSINDWKENSDELALQNGRWYPTAMIMANGSILVIGGQDGSNGKPIPTLELLPRVGPVIEQDFLRRTDPYNLYPFTAVMPSGGIFIGYYNEARIMDEATFSTRKVLPNMPAAVNNFLGGRSYPFSGTMVLMPQHYPYSEPMTVLICGGSVPGPEIALDNCVSAQPEVSEPEWTIERMPSKRVITCMTALPDGTYLILNGAHQGRAGFGTSSDPNLNAVLYDPSQPAHHRMSIMANTTVARLYHSEAILLQDGKVLVSGSDPQDPVNPEEYRVEVFVPPYLLSGRPRPTFNITNKDWSYGQAVTFTVSAGNSTNLKVSLTGAESSTHGVSFGQRTIFPNVTCNRNACTVVAPPNANVCPPGWFQLWLLDGPTPSHSVFVRIGGDPGRLGDWPPYSDFDKPGV